MVKPPATRRANIGYALREEAALDGGLMKAHDELRLLLRMLSVRRRWMALGRQGRGFSFYYEPRDTGGEKASSRLNDHVNTYFSRGVRDARGGTRGGACGGVMEDARGKSADDNDEEDEGTIKEEMEEGEEEGEEEVEAEVPLLESVAAAEGGDVIVEGFDAFMDLMVGRCSSKPGFAQVDTNPRSLSPSM